LTNAIKTWKINRLLESKS